MFRVILILSLILSGLKAYGQNEFCLDCTLDELEQYLELREVDMDSITVAMPDSLNGRVAYYLDKLDVSVWHFFEEGKLYLTVYIPKTLERANYFYGNVQTKLNARVDPQNKDLLYAPNQLVIERKWDMFASSHFMMYKEKK